MKENKVHSRTPAIIVSSLLYLSYNLSCPFLLMRVAKKLNFESNVNAISILIMCLFVLSWFGVTILFIFLFIHLTKIEKTRLASVLEKEDPLKEEAAEYTKHLIEEAKAKRGNNKKDQDSGSKD